MTSRLAALVVSSIVIGFVLSLVLASVPVYAQELSEISMEQPMVHQTASLEVSFGEGVTYQRMERLSIPLDTALAMGQRRSQPGQVSLAKYAPTSSSGMQLAGASGSTPRPSRVRVSTPGMQRADLRDLAPASPKQHSEHIAKPGTHQKTEESPEMLSFSPRVPLDRTPTVGPRGRLRSIPTEVEQRCFMGVDLKARGAEIYVLGKGFCAKRWQAVKGFGCELSEIPFRPALMTQRAACDPGSMVAGLGDCFDPCHPCTYPGPVVLGTSAAVLTTADTTGKTVNNVFRSVGHALDFVNVLTNEPMMQTRPYITERDFSPVARSIIE